MRGRRRSPGRRSRTIFWRRFGRGCSEGDRARGTGHRWRSCCMPVPQQGNHLSPVPRALPPIIHPMATGRERRRAERVPTASIPVQLSDINGELIDLSLTGAAVVHRSPIKAGTACTLIFPSYGGIYIPCEVIRSVVQVRRGDKGPEYVFRSAISFAEMAPEQEQPLHEFLLIQIDRLRQQQAAATAGAPNTR